MSKASELEALFETEEPMTVTIPLFGTEWLFLKDVNTFLSLRMGEVRTGREVSEFLEGLVVEHQRDAWRQLLSTKDLKGENLAKFIRGLTEAIAEGKATRSSNGSDSGRSTPRSPRKSTAS